MNDSRLTNALLIVLILLVAVSLLRPALDGAQSAQAASGDRKSDMDLVSQGERAISTATQEVAKANREIAQSIVKLGDKIDSAAETIAKGLVAAAVESKKK